MDFRITARVKVRVRLRPHEAIFVQLIACNVGLDGKFSDKRFVLKLH